MHITSIWHPGLRIIEFGATNGALGDALVRAGYQHYLSAAGHESVLAKIAAAHPRLQARLTMARARTALRRNNAEVLILRGLPALHVARFRSLRHAHYVALPIGLSPALPLALVLGLVQCLLGRFSWPTIVEVNNDSGRSPRMIAFGVRRRHATGARRYIPHALGIERFLKRLCRQQVRHAVLRWFESLPALPPGEDLDLLVDDADLPTVTAMLDEGPGLQPVDLYSVTGLPGADYCAMPYFPPHVAGQILDRAAAHRDLCLIPSREDHFLSLAYHALYHKGARSGIKSRAGTPRVGSRPEHDYAAILTRLAGRLAIDEPIVLEDLDRYLDQRGWRPPHDMLVRLARRNPWLRTLLGKSNAGNDDGLAVFLLRQEALARGGVERLARLLERHGFYVVHSESLSSERARSVARSIRGGNWGPGPWPISGGEPAAAIVAYDMEPLTPSRRDRKRFPFLANARLLCKNKIRDAFNERRPPHEHCNVVHSSDNGREALDYLRAAMPDQVDEVLARVEQLRREYRTDEPVVGTLTRAGRRAKIELVERDGRLAIKKTFKPRQERFCQRETTALCSLSKIVSCVPPVLECGPNWLVIPYYDNVLGYRRSSGKLLSLHVAKQAIAALREVYEAGYALVDASIDNILVDRREGLKLIDFEFSHRYERKPDRFEQSYDVAGCPSDFAGDVPIQGANSYDRNWRPYIGLSLRELVDDPAWLQHAKRAVYYLAHGHRFFPRLARHYAGLLWAFSRSRVARNPVRPQAPVEQPTHRRAA